ncbi:hypothetical protein MUP59_01485, partial [Candidatus Bathyarchaeota archaeon]|nr:hypothetical protein [Candidatus Bathyarchaeota archaeon]
LKKNLNSLDLKKDVVKYAFHGIWGSMALQQVLKMYAEKTNEYITQHMVKIREGIRQGKQPRVMEIQSRTLKVDWEKEVGLCGHVKKEALKGFELCH